MLSSVHIGTLAARRSAPKLGQSITLKHPVTLNIGSLSHFSTAPRLAVATKKPSPANQYDRFVFPTSLPPTNRTLNPCVESLLWSVALSALEKKQKREINSLQNSLDSLRIAQMPTTNAVPNNPNQVTSPKQPQQRQQQQRTFQVMNRNARKAKRANHGKRPCSRVRRRWKVKKWANTSRRGWWVCGIFLSELCSCKTDFGESLVNRHLWLITESRKIFLQWISVCVVEVKLIYSLMDMKFLKKLLNAFLWTSQLDLISLRS